LALAGAAAGSGGALPAAPDAAAAAGLGPPAGLLAAAAFAAGFTFSGLLGAESCGAYQVDLRWGELGALAARRMSG